MSGEPATAVELFWELMDWKGPAPWRLHEVRRELARLIDEERWADALLLAMVRDRAQRPADVIDEPARPPAPRSVDWRRQEALPDKLSPTKLVR